MSAPAFAWALERGATLALPPADRLVLMYLADMANGARVCWPGQETIVRFTGLALRTVRVALHRLVYRQLIRVEASPGFATKYYILRPITPANGNGVSDDYPGNMSQGNPGKSSRGEGVKQSTAPANRPRAPRQNVPTHPETICQAPRQKATGTPANCPPDPSYTQERDPRARVYAREARKPAEDFQNGEKGREEPAPPPAPPTRAPERSTTYGGDTLVKPGRSSDAFLDDPSPDDALPRSEGDDVVSEAERVDPGLLANLVADMKRAMRAKSYPPRAAVLDRGEQIDFCTEKPPVKAYHLPDAVLRLHRQQLAERAAALGFQP